MWLQWLKKIQQDSFVRHNIIFVFGSFCTAVINYSYHLVLGRLLPVAAFGEVEALISLSFQALVFLAVFANLVVYIVVNQTEQEDQRAVLLWLKRIALIISLVFFTVLVGLSGQLKISLQFTSILPFITLAVFLIVSVFGYFRHAYLQGKHHFGQVALANGIYALGRLVFSVFFVLIGLNTFGAIAGLVMGQLAFWLYTYVLTRKTFKLRDIPSQPVRTQVLKTLYYGIYVFGVSLVITMLYTSDVIVIKYFFSPYEAGLYSGVATVGRIIFFLTTPITSVLFASIQLRSAPATNERLLVKALAMTGVFGVAVAGLCSLVPVWILRLMVGPDYVALAHLLPLVSLMILLISFINVFLMYYLALKQYTPLLLGLIWLGIIVVLVVAQHSTIRQVVSDFILGNAGLLVSLISYMVYQHRHRPQVSIAQKRAEV